jgi:asparagine synthetase B (glutamine-hydrolysing)
MVESLLRVRNLCIMAGRVNPAGLAAVATEPDRLRHVNGRFAVAHQEGHRVLLARDKLGLNKLFFAVTPDHGVIAGNFLSDLLDNGVPLDLIYSVPAGTVVDMSSDNGTVRIDRYHRLPGVAGGATDPARHLAEVRRRLDEHLALVASAHPHHQPVICLSGGLDSALVAALATAHFPHLVAYTYTYAGPEPSPDATAAAQLAAHLGLPFRLITADADKVLAALPAALRHGQDWRDFNVHAAIVNEILAEAITTEASPRRALVLTGDLMNELLGDYTPIHYRGRRYYPLPPVPPELQRVALVRGLQAGDREVGVFAAHDIDVCQPYAAAAEQLLRLPAALPKPAIMRILAGDRLPADAYRRPKARAQIGGPTPRDGILPLLIDSGRDGHWLEAAFCDVLQISNRSDLRRLLRGGVYRCPTPGASP